MRNAFEKTKSLLNADAGMRAAIEVACETQRSKAREGEAALVKFLKNRA